MIPCCSILQLEMIEHYISDKKNVSEEPYKKLL